MTRRRLVQGLVALLGWAFSGLGWADTKIGASVANALEQPNYLAALEALFGARPISSSTAIQIDIDDIAENGSIVPLKIAVALDSISAISVFAPKNPVPLVAHLQFTEMMDPYFATRIKLAESENVLVVVEAGGQLFSAQKYVRVMQGGCS